MSPIEILPWWWPFEATFGVAWRGGIRYSSRVRIDKKTGKTYRTYRAEPG